MKLREGVYKMSKGIEVSRRMEYIYEYGESRFRNMRVVGCGRDLRLADIVGHKDTENQIE